eukprot:CAMPEP_0175612296 /NCGR_PEP_ID=MMETSP0096-20121207/63753_1 /TAXON_ID=311494 /ORGANISM="Alexandrium monilatum, Strain CCMP3105" /LENGTH=47 /DNA_ID= /DNA_START= /DNA_END= /DNA_ORIENTATION=
MSACVAIVAANCMTWSMTSASASESEFSQVAQQPAAHNDEDEAADAE